MYITVLLFADSIQAQSYMKSGPIGTEVNVTNGNLYLERADIVIPARGINIAAKFSYNTFLSPLQSGFGKGWLFSYAISYKEDTIPGGKIIIWGDGAKDAYKPKPGGGYIIPPASNIQLSEPQAGHLILKEADGVTYYFENSNHKKITRIEDNNGNKLTFIYQDTLLKGITHSTGQTITLNYTPGGLLSTLVDANMAEQKVYTYTYDEEGNLLTVTDPLGEKINYTYIVNGGMKTLTDKNNNLVNIIYYPNRSVRELVGCNKRISFSYDDNSNKTVVTDHMDNGEQDQITTFSFIKQDNDIWIKSLKGNCCGLEMEYEYDQQGNVLKETDANGGTTLFTYDTLSNVLSITSPSGNINRYTYLEHSNKITSVTDARGNKTTLEYDEKGNVIKIKEPDGAEYTATYSNEGNILTSTDPKGSTYTFHYDNYGHISSVQGPEGYAINTSFNIRGNLITYTNARGVTTTAEYDILNQLKKITTPLNKELKFNYDAQGNLTEYSDAMNRSTRYSYDASNRVSNINNTEEHLYAIKYDAMDNLNEFKIPTGANIKLKYNSKNQLIAVVDGINNATNLTKDRIGNIIAIQLPNGRNMTFVYNKENQLVKIADNFGEIASLYYDKNGNITQYANALGGTISITYDKKNNITSITDILGQTNSYTYDKIGNVLSATDENQKTKFYTYDQLNRIQTYTDNMGGIITVTYDTENNITSLTDQNNNTTTYEYDNLNRRTRMIFPDGSIEKYEYDDVGNLIAYTKANNEKINYGYDNLNRLTTKSGANGHLIRFVYNELNKIIEAQNEAGTVYLTYDAVGRISSESFNGKKVQYTYNIPGRSYETIYPDGTIITKTFDTRNRLIRLSKNDSTMAEYVYDKANLIIERTLGNSLKTNYQYDYANRLSAITTDANIQQSQFRYDKKGNKIAVRRLQNPEFSEEFTYDDNSRLIQYKRGSTITQTYSYDILGNRLSVAKNGNTVNYTTNNLNQMITNSGINLQYDVNGNLIFDGVYHKIYNSEGQLIKDSSSSTNVHSYTFDALGRRVQKNIAGTIYNYTYSGLNQIIESDAIGNTLNSTVFSGFLRPVVKENEHGHFFYHQNELGSVEAISTSTGRLLEKYTYDPYGKLFIYDSLSNSINSSLIKNHFAFTGQEFDSATNNYRFFYRTYSPETGLFNQRDLIEYQDGMGMYQYVGNNPANGIDIYGLEDCKKYEREEISYKVSFTNEVVHNGLEKMAEWELNSKLYSDQIKLRNAEWAFDRNMNRAIHERLNRNAPNFADDFSQRALSNKSTANQSRANINNTYKNVGGRNTRALNSAGNGLNVLDNLVKGEAFASSLVDGQSDGLQQTQAGGDFALSLLGWTGPGAIYGTADFLVEMLTGQGITAHTADAGQFWGNYFGDDSEERNREAYEWAKKQGWGDKWLEIRKKQLERERRKYELEKCKPKGPKDKIPHGDENTAYVGLMWSFDPNEIIGPEGKEEKKWLSVKDRMAYTIYCENDETATAPARFIRITTPVEPRQDATTLQLGSFGFNNLEFDIPIGTNSYYNRLDCRDSLGLYVDVVAGYDVRNNLIFWEFQSIDPTSLLPSEDPAKGILLLQSTEQKKYGHGFVNFSMKPLQSVQTLDVVDAKAEIIFDDNEMIPTNVHHNTIDAYPPQSLLTLAKAEGNEVTLEWSGTDDTGGIGIEHYSLYISNDGTNYSLFAPRTTGTDTTFTLSNQAEYCFFVLATDKVGNEEVLNLSNRQCIIINNALPVTWLYFNGKNQQTDNFLQWATASEQNTKEFIIERSLNGIDYIGIGQIAAAGNSTTVKNYDYTDRNIDQLNSSIFYYRLKQVDADGQYEYSNVVMLRYEQKNILPTIVYPNPTTQGVTLKIQNDKLIGSEAIVMDMNGKVLQRVKINSANQRIELTGYASGVYFIQLANKENLKVVKQ